MYNFCTLFDIRYLSRGLALYQSLKNTLGKQFRLYVFPFDEKTLDLLNDMQLAQIVVVPLEKIENDKLLSVKKNRTRGEYCWTCTPIIINYCIKKFQLTHCTYLDADIYFFNSPEVLLNQIGSHDIIITPHHFTPRYDQSFSVGKFCVQFVYFNCTKNADIVLNHWIEQCLEWCYDRVEPERFGDQKYLDEWPVRYKGIQITNHFGAGVAPWNVQQYRVSEILNKPHVFNERLGQTLPVIFYHYHGLKFFKSNQVDLGGYQLNHSAIKLLYLPYLKQLKNIENQLKKVGFDEDAHGVQSRYQPSLLDKFKRNIKKTYNIVEV